MTIYETNLHNLRLLVSEFGSAAIVAERCDTSENHLNQILRGEKLPSGNPRGVGKLLARKLEKGCDKPEGWMDQDHTSQIAGMAGSTNTSIAPPPTITDLLASLKGEIDGLPGALKETVAKLVSDYIKSPDPMTGETVAGAIERIVKK